MIGLWQAIVDFRCDKAISFPAFAKVCTSAISLPRSRPQHARSRCPQHFAFARSPAEDSGPDWNLSISSPHRNKDP